MTNSESVVDYCKRAKRLHEECSADLQKKIPQRFLGGLQDSELQFRVQNNLMVSGKLLPEGSLMNTVTFEDMYSKSDCGVDDFDRL